MRAHSSRLTGKHLRRNSKAANRGSLRPLGSLGWAPFHPGETNPTDPLDRAGDGPRTGRAGRRIRRPGHPPPAPASYKELTSAGRASGQSGAGAAEALPCERERRGSGRWGSWRSGCSACLALAAGCDSKSGTAGVAGPTTAPGDPAPVGPPLFEDVTAASGVDFTYRNGEDGRQPSTGHPRIARRRGRPDRLRRRRPARRVPDRRRRLRRPGQARTIVGQPCKLYRNLGGWKFQDVTAEVGLDKLAGGKPWFYTHGVAVADYDRDGWPDLLVTGWRARGPVPQRPVDPADPTKGRQFEDVTAKAGLDKGITWATSAAFADLDGDGYPDLYVCQYVDWSWANNPHCTLRRQDPGRLPAEAVRRADAQASTATTATARFIDVSEEAGLRPGGAEPEQGAGGAGRRRGRRRQAGHLRRPTTPWTTSCT